MRVIVKPLYCDGGSSLTWFDAGVASALTLLHTETFSLPEPGPVPSRQEAPHPHQAFVDPTGRFVLVPDLGADLVRVFRVDPKSLHLATLEPLVTVPGSGPRHVDFLVALGGQTIRTYMYLISELTNTITAYRVSYPASGGIRFDRFFQCPTHGYGNQVPAGASAAEIAVSPDGRYLTVSSRNEKSFKIPNPDVPTSGEQDQDWIDSDSLIVFAIFPETGELSFLQKFPAGGLIPRHFSYNQAGTLVAVALQQDGRVVTIQRDVVTGQLKNIIASARLGGEVTAVIFA
ncbi:3-carboxy-cis,cis-mucoante lactonizing enzyme, partial [Sodiomyces alkalinus F11]